jgi:cobalt-zinc-cadmium efflux system membrane fusion protein
MKNTMRIGFVAFLLLFTSCAKKQDAEPSGEHKVETVPRLAEHGELAVLKVEPSMLRDLRITTAKVEERTGGDRTTILGELRVNENAYAEVGAPIPSGIVRFEVAAGGSVRAGQTLAILQSPEIGKAKADMITAQSHFDLARQVLERKRRLGAERIVSQREIQEAEAGLASAEAELRSARAALQSLGLGSTDVGTLDSPQYMLRSPVGGVVIERTGMQGQMAEPSQPLFRIADLRVLWLTVHAFERDAVRIHPGAKAKIVFAALPGQTLTGKVTLVGEQVDLDSRTVPVRIEVRNDRGTLRPGMSATAFLTPGNGRGKVLSVPAASLQRTGERWVVFVPRSPDEFEIRTVGRGRDLDGEVEILSGLKSSETVVVDGAFLLKAQVERSQGGEHED